ncbi:Leucine Rich repeat/CHAT domain containing protein [Novymonas esmeraldas]|uniref:Leucine Rich repeat/CHAT domain containing protein n=1 Tax=Novymonas esmeraldas TaxID=1808958 RepID=A0AAW0F209_9TRYP
MADASPSTALPALGGRRGSGKGRSSAATVAAPIPADGTMDYVGLYRSFCAEEGCKANSAFVRYIQDRGGHFTLERLNLSNNYLGAKGLRPVLRMIDLCQTIVSINLEDNGIGNDAVLDLCEVLQRHVSAASINLSHNPISVAGGKRLLQLVEGNTRIRELLLDGTDLFEGLRGRIRMALQHNAAVQDSAGPHMEVNKDATHTATKEAGKAAGSRPQTPPLRRRPGPVVAVAATMPPPTATLQPIHHRPTSSGSAVSRRTAATGSPVPRGGGGGGGPQTTTPTAASVTSLDGPSRYAWQEATLGRPQPRPPLPALASQEHKAYPQSKVKDLKALFAERARLHTEVNRGEASRRAYAARQELLALERHGRPLTASAGGAAALPPQQQQQQLQLPRTYPGAATASIPLPGVDASDDSRAGTARTAAADASGSDDNATAEVASPRVDGASPLSSGPHMAVPHARAAEASVIAVPVARVSSVEPSVVAERPEAHTIEDVLSPARMMLLTTEEQFTVLFDQGCREYVSRNLDAAYMAWNEAMRVAVGEGQREWMAVVASNLQRLSYELLVEEGATHLEHGELEKARETFKLAYDVAVKAKNAVWERNMRTAQQNVQRALFHRCHEAALLLFRRAQEDMSGGAAATTVTDDDHFTLPGSDELVRHTAAFVREWSCLLVLKEAIGLWAEAMRVVARLSEAAAAPLRECVRDAVTLVAAFIAEHHFNDTPPAALTWFGSDAFLYHECILLSELWYDLVAYSEQNLQHGLLSAICAAQLGELYVATFQLPQALVQLNKLVSYGRTHRHALLEATGLTLCGRVHLQRADYALAEAALDEALRLWSDLQSNPVARPHADGRAATAGHGGGGGGGGGASHRYDVALMDAAAAISGETATSHDSAAVKAPAAVQDTPEGTSGTAAHGGGGGGGGGGVRFRLESHLPTDAVAALASACRHHKVCLLLRTYRYSAAVEALENSLNEAYGDTLREKLGRNFHLHPSLDEIAAIAGVLRTPLVYYTLTTKYDWAVRESVYTAEESLCIWVVAESREMRFVEVNVTKDFKCTLRSLIASLRQRLCVEPEMAVQSDIITELPSRSWQEPLRVLYQACIHPILGYVRALDPQLLFGDGMITVVPSGQLWLIPFHALLNVKAGDRYLVEEAAVQMAFSATQAALAALSAERVHQLDLHREVVAVQCDADRGAADALLHTSFTPNTDRSEQEGALVAAMLSAGQTHLAERLTRRAAPETAIFTRKVEVVEDVEALRTVLPRARTVHIAATCTTAPPLSDAATVDLTAARPEVEGGLLMRTASPLGDLGVMRAAEIAHMELAAEHVVLTNTNMSPQHMEGVRDDVLGLVRGFFGSGVPCVIAGQWCTPDMKPMELFRHFYAQSCRPSATTSSADPLPRAGARAAGGSMSTDSLHSAKASASAPPQSLAAAPEEEWEEEGEPVRHRALRLAHAIRHLLAEEPAMRYRPRVWAGYYCIGTGW